MAARLTRDEALVVRRTNSIPPAEDWIRVVLPIDKPGGITSFDVIRRLRRVSPVRKIGHAGTLDPMATGLLVCLVGRATKLMESFMGEDKLYSGVIRLGQETPSFDAETEVIRERSVEGLDEADIAAAAADLTGEITQITPAYSAVKVGGERLYRKARRGEKPARPPRQVTVARFEIVGPSERPPGETAALDVPFEVECSSGTYIRALAHDLGQALGTGAHLLQLRRRRSGTLLADDAWPLDEISRRLSEGRE